jgi:hypothetical protein
MRGAASRAWAAVMVLVGVGGAAASFAVAWFAVDEDLPRPRADSFVEDVDVVEERGAIAWRELARRHRHDPEFDAMPADQQMAVARLAVAGKTGPDAVRIVRVEQVMDAQRALAIDEVMDDPSRRLAIFGGAALAATLWAATALFIFRAVLWIFTGTARWRTTLPSPAAAVPRQ